MAAAEAIVGEGVGQEGPNVQGGPVEEERRLQEVLEGLTQDQRFALFTALKREFDNLSPAQLSSSSPASKPVAQRAPDRDKLAVERSKKLRPHELAKVRTWCEEQFGATNQRETGLTLKLEDPDAVRKLLKDVGLNPDLTAFFPAAIIMRDQAAVVQLGSGRFVTITDFTAGSVSLA